LVDTTLNYENACLNPNSYSLSFRAQRCCEARHRAVEESRGCVL